MSTESRIARAQPASSSSADTNSRLGLSRERILDAAIELLDREGLDGFSMRQLADEIGVGTMTLYGYFRRKEELLDAIIDYSASGLMVDDPGGEWKERLRALMAQIHAQLTEHPSVVEMRFQRPLLSPGALEITELGMSILTEAGFSKRDAARAYRLLFVYTFGSAAFGPREDSPTREQTFEAISALPEEQYPIIRQAAREAAEAMADPDVFSFGLDCLLNDLERRRSQRR